jgi:hypothetical protein
MTEKAKLEHDIATLRASIKLGAPQYMHATREEKSDILKHIGWCIAELRELQTQLKQQES